MTLEEQYPYEIYCANCGAVPYWCDTECKIGDAIMASHCLHTDGTPAVVGEEMKCECPSGKPVHWKERLRQPTTI